MGLKKLWVRIQVRLAAEKFFRCGMEFTREWPKEPIEVDEATAERLEQEQMLEVTDIDPNVAALPADQTSDTPITGVSGAADAKTAPEDQAERIEAIRAAVSQLDAGNTESWTTSGSPKTEALGAITGWPVSAADRDAAWALITAELVTQ